MPIHALWPWSSLRREINAGREEEEGIIGE